MTLSSVGDLMKAICVHWPAAKKNMLDGDGKISKAVAEEWYRRIGYLDDAKVEAMFTDYLTDENVNKYPPGVGYFLGHKSQRASGSYTAVEARQKVRFRVSAKGDLIDDEGRIYADPEDPDAKWYCNGSGYICKRSKDGREEVWYR